MLSFAHVIFCLISLLKFEDRKASKQRTECIFCHLETKPIEKKLKFDAFHFTLFVQKAS